MTAFTDARPVGHAATRAVPRATQHTRSPEQGEQPSTLPPGTRIGQYEIIRELGRGGMGAVYAARDTKLGRKVAIKFLNSQHPELSARFVLEAKATARCNHENIIVIHEVGEYAARPFMVLEYLQGVPLSALMQDGRRVPPAQAIELIVPVVRALCAAHAHKIVHRDLKPDNIFVTDAGTIKVLDFGIAKLLHGGDDEGPTPMSAGSRTTQLHAGDLGQLTHQGTIMGTLPYMSPEQWGSGAKVDHQTDVWALGIILFELVTGHHPLAPRAGWDLMVTGALHEPMPPVRSAFPELPDDLAELIDHCLQKDKRARIASAQALLDALEPLLPGRQVRRLRADESPYAGLKAFQESDAHRFFGRARDVAGVVSRLRDTAIVGIVGASGVGKSSFIRAGVLPALKASGEQWAAVVVRPGRAPMEALANALMPMLTTGSRAAAQRVAEPNAGSLELAARLRIEPGYLGAALRHRARSLGSHILLFVDQFEELYTQVSDARERQAFTACLAGACDDANAPLRLALSLRSDFLDHVAESPAFMADLSRGLVFLASPDRDGLRDALVQPAAMAGYQFETPAIVEAMLDHLQHTSGALPLLQFAASQLWEMRDRERRLLTATSYEHIGGIAGALASHAAAVLAECSPREQTLVRALVLRLVTADRTRAIVPINELYELSADTAEIDRVLDRLIRSRLLVSQTTDGHDAGATGTVELVHESLIQRWPLLRRWLEETQEDSAFLEQLRSAARQWQTRGYPQGLLWRGEAMHEARLWKNRYRGELPDLQSAYLDAVFALAASGARRKRWLVIGALGGLTTLVIATSTGLLMIREAQQEATHQASQTREQLMKTKAAEQRANAEREKTTAANRELGSKNAALAEALDSGEQARLAAVAAQQLAEAAQQQAEAAQRKSERSKHSERRSRKRALAAARAAQSAAAAERHANDQLEAMLAAERKRVDALEALTRGSKIIPDIRMTRDHQSDKEPTP